MKIIMRIIVISQRSSLIRIGETRITYSATATIRNIGNNGQFGNIAFIIKEVSTPPAQSDTYEYIYFYIRVYIDGEQ